MLPQIKSILESWNKKINFVNSMQCAKCVDDFSFCQKIAWKVWHENHCCLLWRSNTWIDLCSFPVASQWKLWSLLFCICICIWSICVLGLQIIVLVSKGRLCPKCHWQVVNPRGMIQWSNKMMARLFKLTLHQEAAAEVTHLIHMAQACWKTIVASGSLWCKKMACRSVWTRKKTLTVPKGAGQRQECCKNNWNTSIESQPQWFQVWQPNLQWSKRKVTNAIHGKQQWTGLSTWQQWLVKENCCGQLFEARRHSHGCPQRAGKFRHLSLWIAQMLSRESWAKDEMLWKSWKGEHQIRTQKWSESENKVSIAVIFKSGGLGMSVSKKSWKTHSKGWTGRQVNEQVWWGLSRQQTASVSSKNAGTKGTVVNMGKSKKSRQIRSNWQKTHWH